MEILPIEAMRKTHNLSEPLLFTQEVKMKSSFIKRVGRIISANINSIVDAAEEKNAPAVIEQSIREIDSAISEVKNELGKSVAREHLLTKSFEENMRKYNELGQKVEFALKEEEEELAKAAIKSQIDVEDQIPVLKNALEESKEQVTEYEGYLLALKAKKSEMIEEFKVIEKALNKSKGIATEGSSNKGGESVIEKVEEATLNFDRMIEKQTNTYKSKGFDLYNEIKLSELDALEKQRKIEERLEAFKSKVS